MRMRDLLGATALALSALAFPALSVTATAGHHAARSISGDFDGDGRADKAEITQAGDRYALIVCLAAAHPCDRAPVTSGPAAHLATLGIKAIPRARLAASLPAVAGRGGDAIDLYAEEASSTIYFWNGSGFDSVVRGD